MEQVRWIDHNGKKIIQIEYRELKGEEYINTIEKVTEHIISQIKQKTKEPEKSAQMLVDVRNSAIGLEIVDAFKKSAKKANPYIKKTAIVGAHGVRKILLETINQVSGLSAIPFSDIEKAKDWLAEP